MGARDDKKFYKSIGFYVYPNTPQEIEYEMKEISLQGFTEKPDPMVDPIYGNKKLEITQVPMEPLVCDKSTGFYTTPFSQNSEYVGSLQQICEVFNTVKDENDPGAVIRVTFKNKILSDKFVAGFSSINTKKLLVNQWVEIVP